MTAADLSHASDSSHGVPRTPSPARVRRFGRGTRLLHWLNAVPFLALLVTGLLIYVPELKASEVGGYRVLPLLHVIVGFAWLLAPIALLALLRQKRALATDLADALTPAPGDIAWLRYASLSLLGARLRQPPTGKYNAGQKFNTWYWLLASAVLAITGLILAVNFFDTSRLDTAFVERVFPLHELIALVSILPLAGHLYLTLINRSTRPSLPGIIAGDVDAQWAQEHHSLWYEREAIHDGRRPDS